VRTGRGGTPVGGCLRSIPLAVVVSCDSVYSAASADKGLLRGLCGTGRSTRALKDESAAVGETFLLAIVA